MFCVCTSILETRQGIRVPLFQEYLDVPILFSFVDKIYSNPPILFDPTYYFDLVCLDTSITWGVPRYFDSVTNVAVKHRKIHIHPYYARFTREQVLKDPQSYLSWENILTHQI